MALAFINSGTTQELLRGKLPEERLVAGCQCFPVIQSLGEYCVLSKMHSFCSHGAMKKSNSALKAQVLYPRNDHDAFTMHRSYKNPSREKLM